MIKIKWEPILKRLKQNYVVGGEGIRAGDGGVPNSEVSCMPSFTGMDRRKEHPSFIGHYYIPPPNMPTMVSPMFSFPILNPVAYILIFTAIPV